MSSSFIFIGEHPAIDFANTSILDHGHPRELLLTWENVVQWLSQARLITNESTGLAPVAGARALKAVLDLRQAWARVLAELVSNGKVSDAFLERLNSLLALGSSHEILRRDGKKGFRLVRSAPALAGEKRVLHLIARQIAHFLAEANPSHLHRCANTTSCVLYFYDTTKNHRRQWCSVATCGNRHKVAAFRQRQALAPR